MSFIVKITTKISILDFFCPFRCKKCGKIGRPLCERCKKYIINQATKDHNLAHFVDQKWLKEYGLPFRKVWTCGWRDEVIGQLIQDYKYHSSRAIGPVIAELISEIVPEITSEYIIVPLPTSHPHIRARGFDHTLKITKFLAHIKKCRYEELLRRVKNTTQVGTNLEQRQQQAELAYEIKGKIDPQKKYILLDDVWTTGASLCAAAQILRESGAKKIYGLAITVSR